MLPNKNTGIAIALFWFTQAFNVFTKHVQYIWAFGLHLPVSVLFSPKKKKKTYLLQC
jgi:hypothetical protein